MDKLVQTSCLTVVLQIFYERALKVISEFFFRQSLENNSFATIRVDTD